MFHSSSRDRTVQSAILTTALVLIFSLIFQISIVHSAAIQTQGGFVELPIPFPLPNLIPQRVHSQSTLQNYAPQSMIHSPSLPKDATSEASSNAVVIPNQYIIVLKTDAHPYSSSVAHKVKYSLAEEVKNSVAEKIKKIGALINYSTDFAFDGFSVKIPDPKALDIIKQDPNVAFIEQDKLVHISSQILPTGIKRVGADRSSALAGEGIGDDVDAGIAI